ncbi:MAG: hypothetical protein K2F81_00285 [Ruminococcus sp.]|nr:hypothetical protein [Ruminococcus sp.]
MLKKKSTSVTPVRVDVLETKKAKLNAYQTQFDSVVSSVTSTINQLNDINAGITAEIEEIVSYQDDLEKTKTGLANALDKNSRVIKNFSALLNVD